MPNYEYECERCPRTFEIRQRISEAALTSCPTCGGPVRRLIAAAPFILKGGGWYVTDYPSEARKKGMESEKKASTPAETVPAASAGTQASSTPTSAPTSTTTPSTGTSGSSGAAAASSSSK